jgi:hypothetical protein
MPDPERIFSREWQNDNIEKGTEIMKRITAEIFSPAFFEGHGSNHDFNEVELKGTLSIAINSPVYPKSQR